VSRIPSDQVHTNGCQLKHQIGRMGRKYSTVPQSQGIANTIVQLIRGSASGVMPASQPIRSDERHFKDGLGRTARPSGGIR